MPNPTTSFNPNDTVRIKLTEHGKRQVIAKDDEFNDYMRANRPACTLRKSSKWNEEGWIQGQFWELMRNFTWEHAGGALPFTDLEKI